MNRKRSWITFLLGAIALGFSCLSSLSFAEQQTLSATMSWNGQGTIYVVGPDVLLFHGAIQGVFYVEKASGKLNAAFGLCPITYVVNTEEEITYGSGWCEIGGEGVGEDDNASEPEAGDSEKAEEKEVLKFSDVMNQTSFGILLGGVIAVLAITGSGG